MTTPAEQLATLRAMTANQPDRPDLRPQAAIDAEMRAEQVAEDRLASRRGDYMGAGSQDWLAARRSG